ncbi:uncharacterized protein N7473_008234 [Penicillium subrubescens]|uniref:uncharacterized protein n=1 Tax=Penicillium subrubescens TaxID=1316194 RepID=UPI0025451B18|nr:uncharacterized protein N7473_008234 [Penicillium subrubescens]KAJ5892006.1 hypothetical protein N7473_008234 [Penicillium subrubescens]
MTAKRPMTNLEPLLAPSTERIRTKWDLQSNLLRDNFTLKTWLLLGAVLQGLITLVFQSSYTVLPPFLMLLFLFVKTSLMTLGFIENPQMAGVIAGKFTALLPDRSGVFSGQAADQNVTLIILAARSNHPMGIFGPGFQVLGDYMNRMQAQLANNALQYNYILLSVWSVRLSTFHNIDLGATSWLGIGERSTANQLMFATYFRTLEDVHAYAHSQLHREAWNWWNDITKSHPHLSIMHEVYQAPKIIGKMFISIIILQALVSQASL